MGTQMGLTAAVSYELRMLFDLLCLTLNAFSTFLKKD